LPRCIHNAHRAKYLAAARDAIGNYLSGGNAYKLNLPKRTPVDLFWSVTVYDALTASGLDNGQPFPSINKPAANADGSIDIYFSPTSPGRRKKLATDNPDKTISSARASTAQLRPSSIKPGEQNDLQKMQ
jgi:hypothetical protein